MFKSQNGQPLFAHLKYLFQGEKCPSQLPSIGIVKFFWRKKKKKENRKKFSINKTDNMAKKEYRFQKSWRLTVPISH